MDLTRQCYFIHGGDTLSSYRALKAIETRFLKNQDSLSDFIVYDLEDVSLDTLKQSLLTTPFLVTHRMFVLKNVFSASKATQEGIVALLPTISDSTFVVIYESKSPDKRLSLYSWLTKHVKNDEHAVPQGAELIRRIQQIAQNYGVTVAPSASQFLGLHYGHNTWQLDLEIRKLACAGLSRGKQAITDVEIKELSLAQHEEPAFALMDALRDGNLPQAIRLYRSLITHADPMLLAGTLASQIRTWAKIVACLQTGDTRMESIAQRSGVKPFVVKLSLPLARTLSIVSLKRCYRSLIRFDREVKDGSTPGSLGILLLIVRLHDTLNKKAQLS
ncbi:MAG TPA: DNA polymerase III subunit delta [Patescibacteria group bacterium]